jgi:hypothetical protein
MYIMNIVTKLHFIPNVGAKRIELLLLTWDIVGSSLGLRINYSACGYLWFSSPSPVK